MNLGKKIIYDVIKNWMTFCDKLVSVGSHHFAPIVQPSTILLISIQNIRIDAPDNKGLLRYGIISVLYSSKNMP